MARPKKCENPKWLKFQAEIHVVRQLDLIGRASGAGSLDRGEMLRVALEEFVASRLADASVRDFVESRLGAPTLRLHGRRPYSATGDLPEG